MRPYPVVLIAAVFLLLSPFLMGTQVSLNAQEKAAVENEKSPESSSDDEPKTFKINGVFEAIESAQIKADFKHLAPLKIKRIVAHGTKVDSGKNIVSFETKEIDKKIKKAESDLHLAEIAHADSEFSYRQFLENQKLDRQAAVRKRKKAQQRFDNFVEVDRERQMLSAKFSLKSSQASLENAVEEYEQLLQMYEEDDLTEESEEIVLKRAKRAVESAEFRFEGSRISSERSLNQTIPQSQADQEDSLARAELAYKKSIRDLESARARRDVEMARKADEFKEKQTNFAELRSERKKIVLTSPIDGIVLYGELNRGRLADKPSRLKAGSSVSAKQVVATVVNPRKLRIRVTLEEKNLGQLAVGDRCKVRSSANANFKAQGVVKSISPVPYAGAKYDCVVTLRTKKKTRGIMPTMSCTLEFTEKPQANTKQDGRKKKQKSDQSHE